MYLELTIREGCMNAYILNSDCNALFDGLNNLYRKTELVNFTIQRM